MMKDDEDLKFLMTMCGSKCVIHWSPKCNGINLIKCKTLPPSTFQPSTFNLPTFQPSNLPTFQPSNVLHDRFRGEDHRSSITAKDESRLSLSWQLRGTGIPYPDTHSMYGIFTYIHQQKWTNVGRYTIHGSHGIPSFQRIGKMM